MADTNTRMLERLKKLSFLITGNDYAFFSENPEIEEALKVYVESAQEQSATQPDTASELAREFEAYYKKQQPQWTLGDVHIEWLTALLRTRLGEERADGVCEIEDVPHRISGHVCKRWRPLLAPPAEGGRS